MLNVLLLVALIWMSGCAREEKFPALAQRVASPVDVAVSSDGDYFYVLNTDYDRTYNRGSILVLDATGRKQHAVATPRLGRNLVVANNRMLVTFDRSTATDTPTVHLYSLANARKPRLQQSWPLSCSPLNTVMRGDFPYFFISCGHGELFIGNSSDLSLKHVRTYQYPRRALYLDPQRQLLFAFRECFWWW